MRRGSGGHSFMVLSSTWAELERAVNNGVGKSKVGSYFKLHERGSTFTRELRAGTATFLTMAYVITVNANILADSGGTCSVSDCSVQGNGTAAGPECVLIPNAGYQSCLDKTKSDLIVATVVSSMIGSLAMGVIANLPLGLAPAMGSNAYVAYDLVGYHGSKSISYQTAMTLVLLEGCVFFVISALGLRAKLAKLIPHPIRLSAAAGIGLFIAFVGLQGHQGVGLIGPNASTLVTIAACARTNPGTGECLGGTLQSPKFWLGSLGFLMTCYGLMKEVKGSMIFGILFVTLVSWFRDTGVTYFPRTPLGDKNFNYFRKVVDFHGIKSTVGVYRFSGWNKASFWVAFLTLLYVDMLSTTGTLYTMAEIGEFVNDKGNFEGMHPAFLVDAGSTVLGSSLGVSTVTTYIESSAGIREGGRTGLTSVTISLYFLISLFLAPLLISVPPWAVGPSLVVVGLLMMKAIKDINWADIRVAAPAFLTMLLMPLTYSIANGIVAGMGMYAALGIYDSLVEILKSAARIRRAMKGEKNQVSNATGEEVGV